MSWWDVFIIAFIAFALWRGYKKGLALRLGGWVGATLLFIILWHNMGAVDRVVSARINGREMVAGWIHNYLEKRREGGQNVIDTSALRDLINTLPLPAGIEDSLISQIDASTAAATAHVYDYVAQALAIPVWHFLLFICTWALAIFVFYAVGRLIKMGLRKVPVLETFDRFAGAFFSSFLSLVLLAVIGAVASIIGPQEVISAINSSFFASFLHSALIFLLGGPAILS